MKILNLVIAKIDGCKRNSGNLSTTKIVELIPSDLLMSTISSFKTENKHVVYRGNDCMKKFYKFLKRTRKGDD